MKKLLVFGLVFICIILMYQYPHAMLNPGDLSEGHQKINDQCSACHNPFMGISNDKCISCHKLTEIGLDTHLSQNTVSPNQKTLFHQHLSNQKCTSCHTDHKGLKPEKTLTAFDHEMLPVDMINNCKSCHSQPSDNLHKKLSTDCNNCHSTKGWKTTVTFNHDMIQMDAKNNCASCHNKPDDSFHLQVNENCDKCHSTNQWKPSTFDHSTYFLLDGNHNAKCNTCHTNNNFTAFTCYGCHEHSESKIREEHTEHGIVNFTNCVSCHRSGNEHDTRSNGDLNENNTNTYIKSKENNRKESNDNKKDHDND